MEPPTPIHETLPAVREADHRALRWQLVRDLAVFQAKLFVDGVKDLVLAPVSLVAAVVGMVADRNDPGRAFRGVLQLGHAFDRWVNLFGRSEPDWSRSQPELPPAPGSATSTATPAASTPGLDAYVARVEQVLVEQYRRGGLTAKAKDAIDQAIDSLHRSGSPPR
ncbi:hypothetical protein [Paraliomyxa miuraensis]|uniref:hypothetical protein n=1 Tax=Paraliomyxa miuraensis TaxID=376150 RepID=UPI002255150E|nr:hypothetical protein [Paraliomyxa miuraensis]MCX4247340.1 hypothetical protein [Paraliomyxa miuraensis]